MITEHFPRELFNFACWRCRLRPFPPARSYFFAFIFIGLLFFLIRAESAPAFSLLDGSFEETPSPWQETTNTDCPTWIGNWQPAGGPTAKDGNNYFWAGGACIIPPDIRQINSNSAAQTITLPTDAAALSFWYYAYKVSESEAGNQDQAYIKVDGQTIWSLDMEVAVNTTEWTSATVNLRPYAGQTIELKLGASQDTDNDFGNVFFDDLAIITRPNTLYLPIVFQNYIARDGDGEPNNSCLDALPISTNQKYQFLAQDVDDWYVFHTDKTGDITVELTDFTPIAGQIVLWAGVCQAATFLGHNGDFSTTKVIHVKNQPPGDFILRLINDGPLDDKDPYSLIVHAP